MTTTLNPPAPRIRERLYAQPPGIAIYSPPELGEHWGRRLLGSMQRSGVRTDQPGYLYDLYLVRSDGMFGKHPVKVTAEQALELVPDPIKMWPSAEAVPAKLKRAKARGKTLPTSPLQETVQPVAEPDATA